MFYVLALLVAASRFLPHPPNVACVGALGLLAGCYVSSYRAYLFPLIALFISDLAGEITGFPGLGFYNPVAMACVYGGMMASVFVGRQLTNRVSPVRVAGGSLMVSTLFFLVSNFGVWLGGWYPASASGLLACYVNAIPFYGFTIAGDLAFTAILFTAWNLSPARVKNLGLVHRAVNA